MTEPGTGIDRVSHRGFRLAFPSGDQARIDGAGLGCARDFDIVLSSGRRVPGGRGAHVLVRDHAGVPIRLRPLRHGGWLAGLTRDRFLRPGRAMRELALSVELRARGIALAEPVAAIARRRRLVWRMVFASVDRPDALDGDAWLRSAPDAPLRRAAAAELGRSLRRLHDAGVLHGDLQLRNLLVEPGGDTGPALTLIDLDHARRVASPGPGDRMAELMRLARSAGKLGHQALLDRDGGIARRVLVAYCAGDRALRRAMLDRLPVERRRLRRHRRAWPRRVARKALLLATCAGLVGCPADERTSLRDGSVEDFAGQVSAETQATTPRWSMFALGDTGREPGPFAFLGGQLRVAAAMEREAQRAPVDAITLLGDNFYWNGLDREHLVERVRHNLVRPYCAFLAFDGPRSKEVVDACDGEPGRLGPVPLFAVLGNHDLKQPGSAALEQESVPLFLPGWRMTRGLAEPLEVTPGLSLVLFESEPAIREPERMKAALRDALTRARGPWIVLAAHRPIATDDQGGLPRGGYPAWVREAIAESGRAVQLALVGHHHNLQVFELETPTRLVQVGAGSGGDVRGPLAIDHPDARFGALALGFVRVDLVGATGDDPERLVVSLFALRSRFGWPWPGRASLAARFGIDRAGRLIRITTD